MGRSKQTFFQRRHTDSQEAHEQMLNITNYQGNANQNCNEVPHTNQNGHHGKKNYITDAGKSVKKRKPYHTVGGNESWYSHFGKQYRGSSEN